MSVAAATALAFPLSCSLPSSWPLVLARMGTDPILLPPGMDTGLGSFFKPITFPEHYKVKYLKRLEGMEG